MFGLGTFELSEGEPFPGLVVGDRVLDLRRHMGAVSTAEMLEDWGNVLLQLREIAVGDLGGSVPFAELRPLPPVQPMRQVFCAGGNYRKHLAQIAAKTVPAGKGHSKGSDSTHSLGGSTPFVFAMPASAVSGAHDDVVLWGPGVQHDWELELALVIGRAARNVSPEEAMDCVAGYTISNDVSTRDVMFRPDFPLTDFLMTKGRPGFFPTGPYLVPSEFVDDYRRLRLTLRVNEEVMQDESVADIIFGVEELVSYASTVTELFPGDILLTGSPGRNAGHHGNRWLRPGDVVEGEVTGLGQIRNRCVAPEDARSHWWASR